MKNLINVLVSVVVLSGAIQSIASEVYKPNSQMLSAELTQFQIDPQLVWKVRTGSVVVDLAKKEVNVTLYREFYCPPGKFCAMVMPTPVMLRLPLVSKSSGVCGTVVYTAREDKRMVDGGLQILKIEDNKNFGKYCQSLIAVPATRVTYTTDYSGRGKAVKTQSVFLGKELQQIPVVF